MLSSNPSARPSAEQVATHRWHQQAPVAPLPHVLEGVKRLQLKGLQKLVLQVRCGHQDRVSHPPKASSSALSSRCLLALCGTYLGEGSAGVAGGVAISWRCCSLYLLALLSARSLCTALLSARPICLHCYLFAQSACTAVCSLNLLALLSARSICLHCYLLALSACTTVCS